MSFATAITIIAMLVWAYRRVPEEWWPKIGEVAATLSMALVGILVMGLVAYGADVALERRADRLADFRRMKISMVEMENKLFNQYRTLSTLERTNRDLAVYVCKVTSLKAEGDGTFTDCLQRLDGVPEYSTRVVTFDTMSQYPLYGDSAWMNGYPYGGADSMWSDGYTNIEHWINAKSAPRVYYVGGTTGGE